MANTFQPTIGTNCPSCHRYIENDANIVLDHIIYCIKNKGGLWPAFVELKYVYLNLTK